MAVDLRQNHFRFGRNSGTEAAHLWLGNEDAAISMPTGVNFLLRIITQEVGGTAIANVDYTWQYNLGGAGWNNITTTSSVVKSVTPNTWANGANCTQRLTGTGTFESTAAGCTTDGTSGGTANDIAASGCSETEIGIQIVHADVANGNTIQFRVTSPDTTITNNVTPSLTVIKGAVAGWNYTATGVATYGGAYSYEALQTYEVTKEGTLPSTGIFTRYLELLRTYTSELNLSGIFARLLQGNRLYDSQLNISGVASRLINSRRLYSGQLDLVGAAVPELSSLAQEYTGEGLGTLNLSGIFSNILKEHYRKVKVKETPTQRYYG